MPADIQKLIRNKEKILQTIRMNGPSLPVKIAKAIQAEPLFAAAFLSELRAERKIIMSNMKIGSSPLYYLEGQEAQLENFVEHLNHREKEAFYLIKKESILEDKSLEPVIRVALRAIKDFAQPVRVRINEEIKLFWKYFLVNDDDVRTIIQSKVNGQSFEKKEIPPVKKQEINQVTNSEEKPKIPLEPEKIEQVEQKKTRNVENHSEKQAENIFSEKEVQEEKKKPEMKETNYKFPQMVKHYLKEKDIEILELIDEKKKDLVAKVRINAPFWKQDFYLVAKEKKKINEDDLALALQKASEERMPVLFISSGELNAKAEEYIKKWANLLKFSVLN